MYFLYPHWWTRDSKHYLKYKKWNSAPGYDGISLKSVYTVIDTLVTPLAYITNLSLMEGIFPSELKIAPVLRLYKNNDPMLFNNYHPISLLPFFSNLFERLAYNRLIDFVGKHHLLCQFKFGFRKNHSTFMTLVISFEKNYWRFSELRIWHMYFNWFQKSIWYCQTQYSAAKLYHHGIRGNALQWFNSYLLNKYQYVNYTNTSSDLKLIFYMWYSARINIGSITVFIMHKWYSIVI